MSFPKVLLHLEGAAVLALAGALYWQRGASGWLFALLLLAPDLSMLGYLVNVRVGSVIYNGVHTYVAPLSVLLIGWWLSLPSVIAVGLIWVAHIGMDRMLGYGLKYPTAFKETHFNFSTRPADKAPPSAPPSAAPDYFGGCRKRARRWPFSPATVRIWRGLLSRNRAGWGFVALR